MKKFTLMFSACLIPVACAGLSGCLTADADVYGQEKVLEYVDSVCSAPYELTGKELIQETPDNMEYEFRTLNRDLTFHANSYLSPIQIDASVTSFYSRSLSCDYVNIVLNQYRDQVGAVLEQDSHYLSDYGWYYLSEFQDIQDAVDTLLAADQIYRPELAYNNADFLRENPVTSIHVVWQASEEAAAAHEHWVNLTDMAVTGQNEEAETFDRLADIYAQMSVDGKIPSDGIPEEYLKGKHVSRLDTILLDGRELFYDSEDNPYGPYGLTTDDYRFCWYSSELDSYMLIMDIGFLSDSTSFPLIIREYVRALGGSYRASSEDSCYTSSWTIDDSSWSLEAVYEDGAIESLRIEKNGKELPVSWVTCEEDSHVNATFCVGVTAEDFCRLFDLEYRVNEQAGILAFESFRKP